MKTYPKIQGLYKRYKEGNKKGKFIIGEYSKPEFELLKDIQWTWTEKVDGTNIRIIYGKDIVPNGMEEYARSHLEFKGKTDRAEIPTHLLDYLKYKFHIAKLETLFNKPVCLYGEGYGYKIQKGSKYFKEEKQVGFTLFDVKVGNTWLIREDIIDISRHLNILPVPIIGCGTIQEAINYVKEGHKSKYGNREIPMEGLVIRPKKELLNRRGHRIITKIKYCDFKEE